MIWAWSSFNWDFGLVNWVQPTLKWDFGLVFAARSTIQKSTRDRQDQFSDILTGIDRESQMIHFAVTPNSFGCRNPEILARQDRTWFSCGRPWVDRRTSPTVGKTGWARNHRGTRWAQVQDTPCLRVRDTPCRRVVDTPCLRVVDTPVSLSQSGASSASKICCHRSRAGFDFSFCEFMD